jgi:additional sex combs-like protein
VDLEKKKNGIFCNNASQARNIGIFKCLSNISFSLTALGADQPKLTTSETKMVQEQTPVVLLTNPVVGEQPGTKEKATKKASKKKKETKTSNNTLGFPCMCVLKPMVMCRRCGAFCHSDCITPMSVCTACVS